MKLILKATMAPTMHSNENPYYIEAVTMSESFETAVDRHFRGKPVHRCEITGAFNTEKMVKDLRPKLLRTRRESRRSLSGLTTTLEWASLLFRLSENVFVTVFLQSGFAHARNPEPQHKLAVIADDPDTAQSELNSLLNRFLNSGNTDTGPGFLIMTGGDEQSLERAPLKESYRLNNELLSLHYGPSFLEWSTKFLEALSDPGISILRGDPGTGKTYYLRHVMVSLCETHRFFYVPVDSFGILSSARIAQFWKREQKEFPGVSKVLILEDSENLLHERDQNASSPVSTILNLTDGLLSDALKLHLVCTLNCQTDSLDDAVMRPGRLKFFRDFKHLPPEQAKALASHYGKQIPKSAEPTLAEIFSSPDFTFNTQKTEGKKTIGFSQ